jgi:MFS family permease
VLSGRPLLRLGVALFCAQAAFHVYAAALPLYFASLGFEPRVIGLLIGTAGLAELLGALVIGPAIDRFGGRAVLLGGAASYLAASLGFLATAATPALAGLRLVQGFGAAAVMPSSYSFVPHLARARAQTTAFATLGAAGNVAMALCPPLGIALLQGPGPAALFGVGAALAILAGGATLTVAPVPTTQRPMGLTFRRVWLMPLLVVFLAVPQWGVIQAFVPLEAAAVGSQPAILFTADAIAVLLVRIPAGWVADRSGPFWLAVSGVLAMTLSPLVLLLPLETWVLVTAGVLNGAGAGLTIPPMLAYLSRRSDDATRGTALAYFAMAFAIGMIVGAAGGGLAYDAVGFSGLLVLGAGCSLTSLGVLLRARGSLSPAPPVLSAAANAPG